MDLTSYLTQNGISETVVFLLLALPFMALVVSFVRQFVGIKAFSIYEPLVLAYALFFISSDFILGLKYGLPVFALAWVISEASRRILAPTRLHYISKVSIKISIASLVMLAALSFAVYFDRPGFYGVNVLSAIIILTMIESINLFRIKKGDAVTNIATIETVIITLACYGLLASPHFKSILLSYNFLVVFAIIGEIMVGRWKGLRLSEYIRFSDIFRND